MKITSLPLKELNILNGKIINNAPISIIVLNKKGDIVFTNSYFKKLSKPLVSKNISQIPFFVREGLVHLYGRLLSEGKSFKKEKCYTTNSEGKPVYIDIVAVPIKDSDGEIESALSMAVDVTKEVLTELELSRLNDQLEEKVQERTTQLGKINEKLNSYLKLKSEFIADASHELRTPLSIIKLRLELLERESRGGVETFEEINEEINKITEILSNLTLINSIEEKKEKLNLAKTDLEKLIFKTIKRMRILAENKKIKIAYDRNKEIPVKGDFEKLERLFVNIIKNAIKYGKEGGWIKVKILIQNNFALVSVSDNGIGIPKKDLPHIFDRFYRSDMCIKYGKSGFGLGLAICKWIAEQHKGSIYAKSSLDKGSTFVVKLPIVKR